MKLDVVSVSIVLPCLNEAATIAPCVDRAIQALAILAEKHGLLGEVIVADNGSEDGSQALAKAHGARIVDVPARGYGAALQGGFGAARGRYLVMGDSDCSYDFVEAVPMIEELMQGADMCMGSRFKGEIKPGAMPWKNRYIGNPILSGVLRFLFKTPISDAHCGIRALTRDAYRRLNLSSTGMEFASEMVLKSSLLGLRVAEVPVTLSPDLRGRPPHLNPWRDGFRHLFYMLMLCPTWLFLAPAAALFAIGITVLGALVLSDAQMVAFAGFQIGNHWAVVGSSCAILATQIAFFGIAALTQSYRDGLRNPSIRMAKLLGASKLQYWLLSGMALGAAGFVWAGLITTGWAANEYGQLDAMRGMIASFTCIVIGAQLFFSGFLLSIISGNRSAHAVL